MSSNLEKLRRLLSELFQLDQADLDFGIYRIMNQKRDEIIRFLDDDLLPQVKQILLQCADQGQAVDREELRKQEQILIDLGVDPDTSPKIKELKQRLGGAADLVALEHEVYSHLYDFFRRYYHEGDFLSLRRYKEGVYSIPYEGEEVKLHWANADQYYVKTSEYLRDYTFKMPSGKKVHFQLVAATTEQGNNQAQNGKDRRFILCKEDPLAEKDGELLIRFEYRQYDEERKQDKLNQGAAAAILGATGYERWSLELGQLTPTAKNPDRSLLAKHLTQYTARNTFDYFIHKDLDGFLRRELDFYVKNEVVHLDDIENESGPRVEQYLSKVKAIRTIACKIIRFLDQLENFQKKLWLKKKFVLETNYCVTLDHIPEDLYPEIAANSDQREDWKRLLAIDEIKGNMINPAYSVPLSVEFLRANSHLMIDTKFFGTAFTVALISRLERLDHSIDGIIVHADNFHALNLFQQRYRESINCIYIDPPYNTGEDGFLYKDSYQHSSWLSMLRDRLVLGRALQPPHGTITISIDDAELDHLSFLVSSVYGSEELAKLVWDRNRKNDAKFFSVGHEYMLVYARNRRHLIEAKVKFREPKEGLVDARALFTRLRDEHGDDWEAIRSAWLAWFDNIPLADPRRRLRRYTKVGPRGPYRDDGNINWPGGGGPRYEIVHPVKGKSCKKPNSGWRYPTADRFWEEYRAGRIVFGPDETTVPSTVSYLFEGDGQVMPSVFYSYAQTAAQEFDGLFEGPRVFDNPKNWRDIMRLLRYLGTNESVVADFFAGSGTTAQSVIELNREDSGNRKYLLVETEDYFDTVLIPRIKKVVYSKDWSQGKPISRQGSGHIMKYLRLESYEDTLNNLVLRRSNVQQDALFASDSNTHAREEYMLSYMIDVETNGSASLLNIEAFEDPFAYKLKVQRGDENKVVKVDLVETFNYLIGLKVRHIDMIRDIRVVEGTNPQGERVLVLWRRVKDMDNDALDNWFGKQGYNTRDMEFDLVYVNGDNNLENLRRPDHTWKVRLIEEEFQRLMFDVEDV